MHKVELEFTDEEWDLITKCASENGYILPKRYIVRCVYDNIHESLGRFAKIKAQTGFSNRELFQQERSEEMAALVKENKNAASDYR